MENALFLGTFDGVHKGHISVLSVSGEYRKIALVFKESPKSVMSGKKEALTSFEDKCSILKEAGMDEAHSLEFEKVRNIEAEDFLNMLYKKYKPALISCGFNYNFGKNGIGNKTLLNEFCKEKGIILRCVDPVTVDGKVVSSTLIRNYLKNGEIKKANALLFKPFSFTAKVRKGEQRGRTIGFPTINQEYPKELVKLKFGVYTVSVSVDGKEYLGIADIGIRPTYPLDEVISETFIKDFSGDLYNKNVKITPLEFLREEMKFDSLNDLKNQINADINSLLK